MATPVHVSPLELKQELDSGTKVVLLDVREDTERSICRIESQAECVDLHIPMGEIPIRLDEIQDASRGLPIVVYCHHGVRSLMVGRWLASRGFKCGNLTGGIDAWTDQVDPQLRRY